MKYKLSLLSIALLLIPLLVKGNDAVLIIDVRTDQEWSNGHLESAIHIPLSEIETKLETLSEHKDSRSEEHTSELQSQSTIRMPSSA